MTPRPTLAVVERRLALQRSLLRQLAELLPVTAAELEQEPVRRAAIERMIQAVVDLAIDINGHLATTIVDVAPATGRESFDLMTRAGVLTADHVARLRPAVGLRNVLVQL